MTFSFPQFGALAILAPSAFPVADWARRHFPAHELLDPADCQALLGTTEPHPSTDAYTLAAQAFEMRVKAGRATVFLRAPLEQTARNFLRSASRKANAKLYYLSIDLPEADLRTLVPAYDREAWAREAAQIAQNLLFLDKEGIAGHLSITRIADLEALEFSRPPLPCDRRSLSGPFDLIGSVHGCLAELRALLGELGYVSDPATQLPRHPKGRIPVFLGDDGAQGPHGLACLQLIQAMCDAGLAYAVIGNQDRRLLEVLRESPEADPDALAPWWAAASPEDRQAILAWTAQVPSHLVLDGGRLVAVHGGIRPDMIGRDTPPITAFCTYGSTPGEHALVQSRALADWAAELPEGVTVVFSHQPVVDVQDAGSHVAIDTACLYGGRLSAFRYPERSVVSVPAAKAYAPAEWPEATVQETKAKSELDRWELPVSLLNGEFLVQTAAGYSFSVTNTQFAATVELLQMETVSPRWLIYLPPSMSPPQPATEPGHLEHPHEAFSYYEKKGQTHVVVQEKCAGRRAVVVICRDAAAARKHFGAQDDRIGVVYSRYGRPLLTDPADERELLSQLQAGAEAAGLWEALKTDWLCLEGQLSGAQFQPGQSEEQARIAAGVAAAWPTTLNMLQGTKATDPDFLALRARMQARGALVERLAGLCAAEARATTWFFTPYHLLAAQSGTFFHQPHAWHTAQLSAFSQGHPTRVRALRSEVLDLQDHDHRRSLVAWWQELSEAGAPGIIVKPVTLELFVNHEYLQPAMKVRGREALRMVYGPFYTEHDLLAHHRTRSLKERRELVIRHFVLGKEALTRFVAGQPHAEVLQIITTHLAISTMDGNPLV